MKPSLRPARRWSLLLAITTLLGATAPLVVEASGAAHGGGVPCPAYLSGMKLLKIGFKWTEGPAWDPKAQRWIFSDLMAETEYGITPAGQLTTLRKPAGYPNGRALLPDGRFVVAQHDRTLGIVNGDGSGFRVVAAAFQGKKLNSPNDVTVAKNGDVYFTDPTFGLEGYGPVKAAPELSFKGVYRFRNGTLTLINDSLKSPNGIGLSPTDELLYVSDSSSNKVYTINLAEYNGKPLPAKSLFVLQQIKGGHVGSVKDGLRVDREGNIWASGPGGIGVYTAQGKPICSIPFPDQVANLAPGGASNTNILVTSADKVYLLTLKKPF